MIGSQISAIILAASLAVFAFVAAYIIFEQVTASKRQMNERVTKMLPNNKSVLVEFRENNPDKKAKKSMKSLFANKKLIDIISNELLLANIMMKPEEFAMVWLLVAFLPSGLVALFTQNAMSSITLAVVGAVLPIMFINSRKKKRTLAFETQLGDALIVTCNCLRSGLTFQQAMETIAKEMEEPINVEFGRAITEMQYGLSLEDALNDMGTRIKSPDLMLMVSAVAIQRQTGGNLSEILETIAETIKERFKIKSDIKTMSAQGRVSGMLIGGLPVVLGAFLMVINPNYMILLFTDPLGRIMIAVSVIMETIGFLLIRKVVNIKY
jgi:tight adherence protein B